MRLIELTALLGVGVLSGVVTSSTPNAARLRSRGLEARMTGDSAVDTAAARVALLALQGSALNGGGPIRRYIMLPNLNPLDESDVIKALTALWKPAECTAWQEGTVMWLTCWSRDQVGNQTSLDRLPVLAKQWREGIQEERKGKTPLRVTVQDSHSRLTVTDAQYEQFLSEYMVVPLSSGTRVDSLSGSNAAVTFRRSALNLPELSNEH